MKSGLVVNLELCKLALLCTIVLLIGRSANADNWPTYQHDVAHTGRTSATYDSTLLQKRWSAPQGYATPLVVGNSVYAMKGLGGDATITSFDLSTGAINWSDPYQLQPSRPTVADGLVVFAGVTSSSAEKLFVLDAATGVQKYTVDIPSIDGAALTPTIARNANNQLVAYVANGGHVAAINLGTNSGSVIWTESGSFGGFSIPTLVGNSVVLAGPGQFYAFNQANGASNHFLTSNVSGGGGATIAFDSTRMQFYVHEEVGSAPGLQLLTAFSYKANNDITQIWQNGGGGIVGGNVAIGTDGRVYIAGGSKFMEIDPSNGNFLRIKLGLTLASSITPALTGSSIYLDSEGTTDIYDLTTFQLLKSLPGSRGSANTPYQSPGAIFNGGFALDYGPIGGHPVGFDVYSIPLVPGDFNRDGHVTVSDIPAMLAAFEDLNAYKSAQLLSDAALLPLGDLDSSGTLTNADVQGLITQLKSGGGSSAVLPEPTTMTLLILGCPALMWLNCRRSATTSR